MARTLGGRVSLDGHGNDGGGKAYCGDVVMAPILLNQGVFDMAFGQFAVKDRAGVLLAHFDRE